MTSILSAITGQFIQSIVLSTFIPVMVFVQLFFAPFWGAEGIILRSLETFEPQQQVLVFLIAAILFSGLLDNPNVPLIRLYEGYSWKTSWVGQQRVLHYRKQLRATQAQCSGMRTLSRRLNSTAIIPGSRVDLLVLPKSPPTSTTLLKSSTLKDAIVLAIEQRSNGATLTVASS